MNDKKTGLMKSKKFIGLIILLVVGVAVALVLRQPKVDYSDLVASANLAFSNPSGDTRMSTVSGAVIGASPSVMFDALPDGKISPELMEELSALNIEAIRWPGGTIARRYDFDKTGYGQDGKDRPQFSQNHIHEFVRMVKTMPSNPEVFVVFNITDHYGGRVNDETLIDKNMRMLQYFIDNNVRIAGIEIGNEEYLHEIGPWNATARAKQYVDIAKNYARIIEETHPDKDFKIGLPFRNPRTQIGYQWDLTLIRAVYEDKFADAFIPHVYGNIQTRCKEGDMACVRQSLDKNLEARVQEVAFLSQNGWDVWITEANAINFGHKGDTNLSYSYTDFLSEYNKKFFQVLANNGADYILYHRLAGVDGKPYNLVDLNADGTHESTRQAQDFSF